MESSRKQRWQQLQAAFEPGFGRMLLISVLLHLLVPVLYYTPLFPRSEPVRPPVYRVNLVNRPVKNPQAGRPEAVASKPKHKAKPKPAPVKPKPIPSKPKPAPVKPKPIPKSTPKPKSKPEPNISKAQENTLQKRLKELRAKQEQRKAEEARKERIEELKALAAAESQAVASPVKDAPVGMPEGTGKEAGVAAALFVQEFIQQQWSLSKYQVSGSPEAEVLLVYSADGELLQYRFEQKSGNTVFDDSLLRAISKSQHLPQPLPEEMDFHIIFNLKDMLDRQK